MYTIFFKLKSMNAKLRRCVGLWEECYFWVIVSVFTIQSHLHNSIFHWTVNVCKYVFIIIIRLAFQEIRASPGQRDFRLWWSLDLYHHQSESPVDDTHPVKWITKKKIVCTLDKSPEIFPDLLIGSSNRIFTLLCWTDRTITIRTKS